MDRMKENGIITPHYVSGCQLCKMRRGLGRRRGLCGPPLHSMPTIKGERVSRHLDVNYFASDSGVRLPTFRGRRGHARQASPPHSLWGGGAGERLSGSSSAPRPLAQRCSPPIGPGPPPQCNKQAGGGGAVWSILRSGGVSVEAARLEAPGPAKTRLSCGKLVSWTSAAAICLPGQSQAQSGLCAGALPALDWASILPGTGRSSLSSLGGGREAGPPLALGSRGRRAAILPTVPAPVLSPRKAAGASREGLRGTVSPGQPTPSPSRRPLWNQRSSSLVWWMPPRLAMLLSRKG